LAPPSDETAWAACLRPRGRLLRMVFPPCLGKVAGSTFAERIPQQDALVFTGSRGGQYCLALALACNFGLARLAGLEPAVGCLEGYDCPSRGIPVAGQGRWVRSAGLTADTPDSPSDRARSGHARLLQVSLRGWEHCIDSLAGCPGATGRGSRPTAGPSRWGSALEGRGSGQMPGSLQRSCISSISTSAKSLRGIT
jgi:hypothetical protein